MENTLFFEPLSKHHRHTRYPQDHATLFKAFVASPAEVSIQGIVNALREAMWTLQSGAGLGIDFSTLRCDHPDIESFINAKTRGHKFSHFKLTVAVTDDCLRALDQDEAWPLVFPLGDEPIAPGVDVCERIVTGSDRPQLCRVHRRLPARVLWDKLLAA